MNCRMAQGEASHARVIREQCGRIELIARVFRVEFLDRNGPCGRNGWNGLGKTHRDSTTIAIRASGTAPPSAWPYTTQPEAQREPGLRGGISIVLMICWGDEGRILLSAT